MSTNEITKLFVVDTKSGVHYGMKLDANGACLGFSALSVALETADGRPVTKFTPNPNTAIPYSQTSHVLELTQDGTSGAMFTVAWPSQEAMTTGTMPSVVRGAAPVAPVNTAVPASPAAPVTSQPVAAAPEYTLDMALKELEEMIGPESAKHDIRQNLIQEQFNQTKKQLGLLVTPVSHNMVLSGLEEMGKTTFVEEVAKIYHALRFTQKEKPYKLVGKNVITMAGPVGPGGHSVAAVGGAAVSKINTAIREAESGFLYVEDVQNIAAAAEPASMLTTIANSGKTILVISGPSAEVQSTLERNPSLKACFNTFVEFGSYNSAQLGQILDKTMKKRGYSMDANARAQALKMLDTEKGRAGKEFRNGRTVRILVDQAERALAMRLQAEKKLVHATTPVAMANLKEAMTTITLKDILSVALDAQPGRKEKSPEFGLDTGTAASETKATPTVPKTRPTAQAVFKRQA